jgi:hypothetical protein
VDPLSPHFKALCKLAALVHAGGEDEPRLMFNNSPWMHVSSLQSSLQSSSDAAPWSISFNGVLGGDRVVRSKYAFDMTPAWMAEEGTASLAAWLKSSGLWSQQVFYYEVELKARDAAIPPPPQQEVDDGDMCIAVGLCLDCMPLTGYQPGWTVHR